MKKQTASCNEKGKIKSKIKKETVFIVSVAISLAVIVLGIIFKNSLNNVSSKVMSFISENFGWLYVLAVFGFCIFLLWIAFSKYGKIKLGDDDSKPEHSNFAWFSMLFCGGTGIGLVFWSIAEPLSHYANPPAGVEAGTLEAVNFSIRTCFLHWGITQWVCFAIIGLAIAYFKFRKKKNGQISCLLAPLFGDKVTDGVVGKIIDIFSIVVSVAGVATSLGLGVSQICGGLNYLWDVPNTNITCLICILVITVIFLASAISGVNRGIKFLSNINTWIALLLLALAFIVGGGIPSLNMMVNGVGQHVQNFFGDVLMINAFGDNDWIMNWRVFYYAWFVAWVPFVGMFLARISKGRTIKEFILGAVLAPTIFTIVWLSVFATMALSITGDWSLDAIRQLVASPETAVFIVFEKYPLSKVMSILVIILLGIFFITSADSATYSLSIMSSNGTANPPVYKKIIWAIIIAAISYVLLSVGSLKPLQTISIAASFPFLIIMILTCFSLVKALKKEKKGFIGKPLY